MKKSWTVFHEYISKEKNRSFKFSVREIRELMISHVVKDRYHIWKFGKLIGHSLESFFREVSFAIIRLALKPSTIGSATVAT